MSSHNATLPRSKQIEIAIRHMKRSRDILGAVRADQAAKATRTTLKSLEGAMRHARAQEGRQAHHVSQSADARA